MKQDQTSETSEAVQVEEVQEQIDLSQFVEPEQESEGELSEPSEGEGSSDVAVSNVIDIPAMAVTAVEVGGSMYFGEMAKMSDQESEGLKALVPAILVQLGLDGSGKVSPWGALAAWSVAYATPRLLAMQAIKQAEKEAKQQPASGLDNIGTGGANAD